MQIVGKHFWYNLGIFCAAISMILRDLLIKKLPDSRNAKLDCSSQQFWSILQMYKTSNLNYAESGCWCCTRIAYIIQAIIFHLQSGSNSFTDTFHERVEQTMQLLTIHFCYQNRRSRLFGSITDRRFTFMIMFLQHANRKF